jgi:choline monooxygenase
MEARALEPGSTVPWELYVSPDVLRREREAIFRRAWHYAGPVSGLDRAGERLASFGGPAPRPALVETWGPFVFVTADPGAAPLRDALGPVPELLECDGIDIDCLVVRERVEYELHANWKIAVENYLECYHCPVAHPGFSSLVDVDPDSYRLEAYDGVWSQFGVRRARGPGAAVCQFHLVWPCLKLNVLPGPPNLSIGPVWPVAPERSAGFLDYFFGTGVSEDEASELVRFDDQVGREDAGLVESVQRGVRSGMIEGGRLLLSSEHLIRGFQRRVLDALGEAGA